MFYIFFKLYDVQKVQNRDDLNIFHHTALFCTTLPVVLKVTLPFLVLESCSGLTYIKAGKKRSTYAYVKTQQMIFAIVFVKPDGCFNYLFDLNLYKTDCISVKFSVSVEQLHFY